jgi:hypothetical protein
MRRFGVPLAATALLVAGGFAAAAIASGGGITGLTTTSGTLATPTSTGPQLKVTICHRTGSKKHRFVTITVAAPSVPAHLAHGDVVGACTLTTVATIKAHGHGKGHGGAGSTGTTTQTTSTTSAGPGHSGNHRNSGNHGNAGGNGHGNGGGHGHH